MAGDFEIEILASGVGAITAAPGELLTVELVGELCDPNNLGLAAFRVDLTYSGGDLQPFADPTLQPMLNFSSPLGLANPAGFGGTPIGGDLIQIGGAQNTINQFFAPTPNGAVSTSVAHPAAPVVLAIGVVTVPNVPGVYTISALDAGANVIEQTATGIPFWKVEPADVTVLPLIITVNPTLTVDVPSISLGAGGTASFGIDAGPTFAGRLHLLLGSLTGSSPATTVGGIDIPLVVDAYTLFTLANPIAPPLVGALGALDGGGLGSASLSLPPASDPGLAGLTLHYAYILPLPTLDFASNAVTINLVP